MNQLALEIRAVCHDVMPGWHDEGWGNVLELEGFTLRVAPGGLLGRSFIQVSVMPKDAPGWIAVPFHRELNRQGECRNEKGHISMCIQPSWDWLVASLEAAVAWIKAQTGTSERSGGRKDL